MRHRCVPLLLLVLAASSVSELRAQDTLPPHQGGYIRSLGVPATHHPYGALALGWDRGDGSRLGLQLRAGAADVIGSPVAGLLSLGAEVYGGVRDGRGAAGLRGLALSPLLGAGAGVDLDPLQERADPFVTVVANVRRGGVSRRGTHLRLEWYPARGHSLATAFTAPLAARHAGRTRPWHDHVVLRVPDGRPSPYDASATLAESLHVLRESGHRINRAAIPPLGRSMRYPHASVEAAVAPLRAQLAERSPADEVQRHHREMERAFSIAAADCTADCVATATGVRLASRARQVLLENVLFPYNRLLGQQKREDTTLEFAHYARGSFARWLVQDGAVAPERMQAILHVFQNLLDITEEVRARNRADWGDSRLVWLPLQLALEPHEHVLKESLDTLVSHAVGRRIQHGNRMWYLYNSRFHQQLIRSIAEAREYHVLWVHDFRGLTDGDRPDTLSLMVAHEYFRALTRRVAEYDSVGTLPAFMIFLDQHYFERNGSRDLLQLLQDPMQHRLKLGGPSRAVADSIAGWQDELRRAVAASRLLTVERQQYGEAWLRRLVSVHVSVTNPADPSFRSSHGRWPLSFPDDVMRDHRKAVVYDVSEEDPFAGMAMYAGMGVGENYASRAWEDRALMLQGPAALSLRDAARRLLETQGIRGSDVPHVLRPRRRPPDYDQRIALEIDSMDAKGEVAVRAIELHNTTGFGPKEITVAQATLLNLAAPGTVFKIPDSLWMNELFAALAAGAALRGVRVLPIAPSASSAPAPALGLIGIHNVFSRLVAFSRVMRPEMERTGGLLRPGIYHARGDVDDIGARVLALAQKLDSYPFLRDLYPSLPAYFDRLLPQFAGQLGTPATARDAAAIAATDPRAPAKLHLKGFLYVSGPAWESLIEGPPLLAVLQLYLEERQRVVSGLSSEEALVRVLQRAGAEVINPIIDNLSPAARSEWAFYLQIGSPNLDYRSMLMDGEVAALVSDWTSLYAFFDFMLLLGQVEWVEDQESLDALIPPRGAIPRRIGRWIRFGV